MGPARPAERKAAIEASPLAGRYEETIDRRSAHEVLGERAEQAARELQDREEAARAEKNRSVKAKSQTSARQPRQRASNRQSVGETLMKSVVRSLGSNIGRQLVRGLLGSLFKGR
jgi:hypothetical protein